MHTCALHAYLCTVIPALADACVVHWRLHAGVGANQQDDISLLDASHSGVGHIGGADVSCIHTQANTVLLRFYRGATGEPSW
jgi:hypothetical protein